MARWIFQKRESEGEPGSSRASVSLHELLRDRGISSRAAVEEFLNPAPELTHDPFLLEDMREATDLILKTADGGGKICIFGDYDADGITSATLLLDVLSRLSSRVTAVIPSRFTDGYGLNMEAVAQMAREGTDLLITVDCGSSSRAEVEAARALGLSVIVTDHHSPSEETSPPCLFINPKRKGSRYPYDSLSGCGVAFKLAQALERTLRRREDDRFDRADLHALLDLVAISTVADVVPLLDENRTLVKYGLDRINRRQRPGLRKLLEALGLGEAVVSAEQIAFQLAPAINAVGRMGHAGLCLELLSREAGQDEELAGLVQQVLDHNRARKEEQERVKKQCLAILEEGRSGSLFPVLLAPRAHEGVAGIVAGQLKETLHRPVFILTAGEEGKVKGTGRSIPGFNLFEALEGVSHLFESYGGHEGACGLTMEASQVEAFRAAMQEAVQDRLLEEPQLLEASILIERRLSPAALSMELAGELALLEPFGCGNPKPLFTTGPVRAEDLFFMGEQEEHLRFAATGPQGDRLSCVLFRQAEAYRGLLSQGDLVEVAGELSINEYRGRLSARLLIRDIKRSEDVCCG